MRICEKCGKTISDEDYDKYQGFCTDCLYSEVSRASSALPTMNCSYCGKPALVKCAICGKLVCGEHARMRKGDTNPSHARCIGCVPQSTYRNNTRNPGDDIPWRCICRIILLIVTLILTFVFGFGIIIF